MATEAGESQILSPSEAVVRLNSNQTSYSIIACATEAQLSIDQCRPNNFYEA